MGKQGEGITIKIGNPDKTIGSYTKPNILIQGQAGRGIDIVLVIDTTGSMDDKIGGLLATCDRFVDLVKSGFSHRIAVVAFGDIRVPEDEPVVFGFTDSVSRVKVTLKNIPRLSGGSNEGETSLEALELASGLPFRPNVVKAIVLITDEPAVQQQITAREMTQRLIRKELLTFVVSPPYGYFKDMAARTGGVWYRVSAETDFTGLLSMFKDLAARLNAVADDVYRLGNGNVTKYLQLKASKD